jgi:hypothetical protein
MIFALSIKKRLMGNVIFFPRLALIFILTVISYQDADSQTGPPVPEPIWIKIRPGMAFTKPDPHIFGTTSGFIKSTNYNLGMLYNFKKHFALNLDLDYRTIDFQSAIKNRYSFADINGFSGPTQLKPLKTGNAILSVGYMVHSKNKKSFFDISLGGGYQRLQRGNTTIAFQNPHRMGTLDTVYMAPKVSVNGVVGQIGAHYTYFIASRIGLQIGGRIQFNGTYSDIMYNTVKADANGKISTKDYCNCETVTGSTRDPVVYIAEAGVTLRLGPADKTATEKKDHSDLGPQYERPDHDTSQNKKPCNVNIWPKNIKADAACYDTSRLCYGLSSGRHDGLLNIYAAPLDDLSNKKLITTVSAGATQVTMSSALLLAGLKYFISAEFVKNATVLCASGCSIPPRCDAPCSNTGKGARSLDGKK